MFSVLAAFGGLIMGSIGFLIGRFYAESERILSEKRKTYVDFLSELPPLNDMYLDTTDEELLIALRPAMEHLPSLIFYADANVVMAWDVLHQRYFEAHDALTPKSPPLDPAYKALATAQNDLVLEMRRDAFRFSIFNYSGKSRVPEALESPSKYP